MTRTGRDYFKSKRFYYFGILAMFSAIAAFLYALPFWLTFDEQLRSLSQAVADALIVAVIVSLAVEPRLLRYFGGELKAFGEELGTQAFWSSFYSRAPKIYIDAVQDLAQAEQYTIASKWTLSFDWADDQKKIVKLTAEFANYRQNRSSKEYRVLNGAFILESSSEDYETKFLSYILICEALEFHKDLLKDGEMGVTRERGGIIRAFPLDDSGASQLVIPPGERFTMLTGAETYLPAPGFFPLANNEPTLEMTIRFRGNALGDLDFNVFCGDWSHLARGQELSRRGDFRVGEVLITGQNIVLSWSPTSN
jgi:hypothetical protein